MLPKFFGCAESDELQPKQWPVYLFFVAWLTWGSQDQSLYRTTPRLTSLYMNCTLCGRNIISQTTNLARKMTNQNNASCVISHLIGLFFSVKPFFGWQPGKRYSFRRVYQITYGLDCNPRNIPVFEQWDGVWRSICILNGSFFSLNEYYAMLF